MKVRYLAGVRRRALLSAALFGAVVCAALSGAVPALAAPWDKSGDWFPSSFDLRAHDKLTGVRSQDGYSTCWIQAGMGSLESCLRPGVTYNLSENNAANHMGWKHGYEGLGSSKLLTAYFARWDGPVFESADRYPRPGLSPEGLQPVRHIQDVLYLPRRSGALDNKPVKWAVMTYGAVDAAMAYETNAIDFATGGSFYTRNTAIDHHVCIVGWKDDYPTGKFLSRPPGPGAFLIRNSWGTDWNNGGYFWISYYDASLGKTMAVFNGAQARGNFEAIYQYDALGWSKSIGYGTRSAWFANRFTCAGRGTVAAASFYTAVPGATYEVRVAPTVAGIAAAPVAGSGTIAVAGYHTMKLATPVAVVKGAEFVVAVKLTTPSASQPIPVEHPSSLIAPRASLRQSYISRDASTWTDLASRKGFERSNVCLKAFVKADINDTSAPKVVVAAESARRGGTANVPYRLSDPGFSCGSAVVCIAIKRHDGTTVKRTRIPGVSIGESSRWKFGCSLSAGTYVISARAYDVVGNAQGSASTAVLHVL